MLVLVSGLIALAMACGGDDDSTSSGDTKSAAAQTSAAAATSSASGAETSTPADSSAPTPTPRPTDTPGPNDCTATAHMNDQAPPQKFTEIVTGVLTCTGASPQGALMQTVWHEKSATKTCGGTADVTGQADCSRMISLISGFTVGIDVTLRWGTTLTRPAQAFRRSDRGGGLRARRYVAEAWEATSCSLSAHSLPAAWSSCASFVTSPWRESLKYLPVTPSSSGADAA